MMKKTALFLILCLVLTQALPALGEDGGILTVRGSATVTLSAEYATLSVGVDTENANVAEAQRENARLTDLVIAALKEAGCDEKDMKTGGFDVYTSHVYTGGGEEHTLVYHVSNSLDITVRDPEKIGTYIDAAGNAGANRMNSLTFRSSRQSEAYDLALADACADAKAQAEILAGALGVGIGGIVSVTVLQNDVLYSRSNGMMRDEAAEGKAEATAILAGDLSVAAQVEVVFRIK